MHRPTIKLLLTYYLNIGVQAANLSDCRIESNRNFFVARIGMLYCSQRGEQSAERKRARGARSERGAGSFDKLTPTSIISQRPNPHLEYDCARQQPSRMKYYDIVTGNLPADTAPKIESNQIVYPVCQQYVLDSRNYNKIQTQITL